MSNYAEKIVKGSFVIFILGIVTTIIGYLLRLYLARNLTVADFGLFYATLSFISLFWVFKDFGIGSAIAKYIPEFYVKEKFSFIKTTIMSIFLVQIAISIIIFALIFVFSDYISVSFFHNINAKPILQILSIEILVATTIIRPVLQGLQKIHAYALVELVRIVSVFAFVFFLIYYGTAGIALSYLFASIIVQIIFLAYIFRITGKMKGRTKIIFDKKLFSFGFFIFIGGLAGFLVAYTDTLVLTFFRTANEVGLYQVAMPTSQLLWFFAGSLTIVLYPIMAEIWAKNHKDLLAVGISFLVKFSMIFMMPFVLIIIAFPDIVINLIFGPRYISASLSLQILGIGAIFYTLMTILSTAINAIGRPDINMKIIWIIAIFNLIGNLIFVPLLGIIGASIISTLSFFLGFLILALYTKKHITVSIPWSSLMGAFLSGIAALLVIYIIKGALIIENSIAEATISIIPALIFYFVLISRTKIIKKNDLEIFKKTNIYMPKFIKSFILRFARL